jgi:hypothetical protein
MSFQKIDKRLANYRIQMEIYLNPCLCGVLVSNSQKVSIVIKIFYIFVAKYLEIRFLVKKKLMLSSVILMNSKKNFKKKEMLKS